MTSPPKHVIINCGISLAMVFMLGLGEVLNAQVVTPTVVNTNGFSKELQGGFVTISVGESAVTTLQGLTGIITQGFLQPETEPPCSDFELEYFPNPVESKITIRDAACGRLIHHIEVFDLLGNTIFKTLLINHEADLSRIGVGVFIVRGYSYSEEVLGTFKIVKIKG